MCTRHYRLFHHYLYIYSLITLVFHCKYRI